MSTLLVRDSAASSPFDEAHVYGPTWDCALRSLQATLRDSAQAIIQCFYARLDQLPALSQLVKLLSERELRHLKLRQVRSLLALASPDLTDLRHRDTATHTGQIHAMAGVGTDDLAHGQDLLHEIVRAHVNTVRYGEGLAVLTRRLIRDLGWQIEASQRLQAQRHDLLLRVIQFAWTAISYGELITKVTDLLTQHAEIAGCSFGRPDGELVFRYEAVAGEIVQAYLADVEHSDLGPIMAGAAPTGLGPAGRSWQSGEVERCLNFVTDPRMVVWKALAQKHGIRSSVAIPICQPGGRPKAILSLYSRLPGGFTSCDQRAFVAQLQAILVFAITQIESQQGTTDAVHYTVRRRWSALMRSDALEMFYQPLLRLADRKVCKVEALARLRDGDRLLSPGTFLRALSTDDLLELYLRGLEQALGQRNRWLEGSLDIPISINLPPSALGDVRYLHATERALRKYSCPPRSLTLEILETDAVPANVDIGSELGRFKSLGVNLSEDDLGSGHSSLSRLRKLPFDSIKIDRSIVAQSERDAPEVLHFIYRLTRLGHSLGKSVVVEGVEDENLLEAVAILGADAVQGYVVARPMSAVHLTEWMAKGNFPSAIDPNCPKTPLAKLVRLIIWEECLHLLVTQSCNPTSQSECGTQGLPFPSVDAVVQRAVIQAAVTFGPGSVEYELARKRLIEALKSD